MVAGGVSVMVASGCVDGGLGALSADFGGGGDVVVEGGVVEVGVDVVTVVVVGSGGMFRVGITRG